MSAVIDLIKSSLDYIGSNGRKEEEIDHAENMLRTHFAEDYRSYLKEIGLACLDGHELTGLTKISRLNVVSVTQERRKQFGKMVASWYVIEEIGVDGIIIWQSPDGTVYETYPNAEAKRLASSLLNYIKLYTSSC